MSLGGRFTLSDDSHGMAQVGTNYGRLLYFIRKAEIKEIWFADREAPSENTGLRTGFASMSIDELERDAYWVKAASKSS